MPIATPDVYAEMIDRAKSQGFAYPAINVTSSQTLNAAIKGFADAGSDGIIQFSTGGAEYASGQFVKDMVTGAVALAEFAHVVAKKYPVNIAIHTDHCPKDKLDTYVRPLLEISRQRVAAGQDPLFQSHMWDGSAVPLEENLQIGEELLALTSYNKQILEVEIGVVGGDSLGEQFFGELEVLSQRHGRAVPHVRLEQRILAAVDALLADGDQRTHKGVQLVLGAVVGVQRDVDRVLLGDDVGELGQGMRASHHVLDGLAAEELGSAGRNLHDAVRAGLGEALQRRIQRLGGRDVDGRVGEVAGLGAVEHLRVNLRCGNWHFSGSPSGGFVAQYRFTPSLSLPAPVRRPDRGCNQLTRPGRGRSGQAAAALGCGHAPHCRCCPA